MGDGRQYLDLLFMDKSATNWTSLDKIKVVFILTLQNVLDPLPGSFRSLHVNAFWNSGADGDK